MHLPELFSFLQPFWYYPVLRSVRFLIFDFKFLAYEKEVIIRSIFSFIAWAFASCEALSDCGFCKNVTYENGSVINEGSETEYCGADLEAQKAIDPVTVGNLTTKVECR